MTEMRQMTMIVEFVVSSVQIRNSTKTVGLTLLLINCFSVCLMAASCLWDSVSVDFDRVELYWPGVQIFTS